MWGVGGASNFARAAACRKYKRRSPKHPRHSSLNDGSDNTIFVPWPGGGAGTPAPGWYRETNHYTVSSDCATSIGHHNNPRIEDCVKQMSYQQSGGQKVSVIATKHLSHSAHRA